MKYLKFISLFLFVTYNLILNPYPVSAHFVKSDAGIGAVLHVDPGDDPIAGQQSNIILEYKDVNNTFDLTNCDCELSIFSSNKELTSIPIHPVAPEQKLSSVTPFTFPQKDVYKLKITGSSLDNSYPNFELNYDVRVEKESLPAPSQQKEDSWWSGHIIHLVGGLIIGLFLIVALLAQNKKKVAVIILVLLLLAHTVPIKAIHASHDGLASNDSYACCLPSIAVMPALPSVFEEPQFLEQTPMLELQTNHSLIFNLFYTRPPPF